MDGSKNVKVPLEHANIHYIGSVTRRTWRSNICQECTIEKYADLKDNIHYSMTREVLGRERVLKFYKTKRSHFFQLHCELRNVQFRQQYDEGLREDQMIFYIVYEQRQRLWPGDLTETKYGYSIEVPNKLVLHSDNRNLHGNNTLVIEFNYRYYPHARPLIFHTGKTTKEDEEAFSNDILSIYENQKENAEFGFLSEDGKVLGVDRHICDARSDTLMGHLFTEEKKCIAVGHKQRIVDIVLRYVFCGKLDELSLYDLIEVLSFASKIALSSLRQSLVAALREKLNHDNARRIWQAAECFELHELSSYAKDFIPQDDLKDDQKAIERKAILKSKLREKGRRR